MTETDRRASPTARALAREQITELIRQSARRQLATVGPAELSLRAVAREVGMVSSAVYRYFASRDELLTELLVLCYDEVGAVAEAADAAVIDRDNYLERWLAVATAFRTWSVAHPHDFALLYGSPVPGYSAPERTVQPATRVAGLMVAILRDQHEAGRRLPPSAASPKLHRALAGIRGFAAADLPDDVLVLGLQAWSGLVGSVTLELFGHLVGAVDDHDTYFAAAARRLAPILSSP